MSFSRRIATLVLVPPLVACTSAHESTPEPIDAGPSALAAAPADVDAILSTLATHAAFAGRLGVGRSLARDGDSLVAETSGAWRVDSALVVRTPTHARGATRLERRARPGVSIELRAQEVDDVTAEVRGGAAVFARAAVDVDVVHVATEARFEELRVLRSPRATSSARWSITIGDHVSDVRARGDVIEVVDDRGAVALTTEPAFAVDARGLRRPLAFEVRGIGHARTIVASLDARGLAYPIAVDPTWTATTSMNEPRVSPMMVTLASGQVLVAGGAVTSGCCTVTPSSTAELYDPASATFRYVGPMSTARSNASASALRDGTVLAVGGDSPVTSTSERFDPSTEKWTASGAMSTPRDSFTLTMLADGRLLAAGGRGAGGTALSTAEIYDPSTGTWSSAGTMAGGTRYVHTATLLKDGRVFVAGGFSPGWTNALGSTTIYDPSTNSWAAGPSLVEPRGIHVAAATGDGRVLVAGGYGPSESGGYLSGAEIFDPGTAKITALPSMSAGRASPTISLLPTGGVLVAGGNGSGGFPNANADVFEPTTNAWHDSGAKMNEARVNAAATALASGTILVAGGAENGGSSTAELYFSQIAQGAVCASNAECVSGFCVDGVCCDQACTGQCMACDVAGSVGTCSAVTGAPHGTRASCGEFLCAAGACATSCSADASCVASAYCAAGACVAKKVAGASCGVADECASGSCVDGVCCDRACDGQCEACDVAGHVGACTPVKGATHGARPTCAGAGTECGLQCDGVDAKQCNFPSASTPCSKNACVAGKQTHASNCNGTGACNDVPQSCLTAYACGATSCNTQCATSADCASGYACVASACVITADLGAPCTSDAACTSGHCVDHVCCGAATCPSGQFCNLPTSAGTCAVPAGATSCADSSTQRNADGTTTACAPFRCVGDRCKEVCASTDDCDDSTVCDPTSKTCVTPESGAASSGGCATGRVGARGSAAGFAALLLLLRRRRARR